MRKNMDREDFRLFHVRIHIDIAVALIVISDFLYHFGVSITPHATSYLFVKYASIHEPLFKL